jgi:hypothetical protein
MRKLDKPRLLYHYINGKQAGVYSVDPAVSVEQVFEETMNWPGVRLILIS